MDSKLEKRFWEKVHRYVEVCGGKPDLFDEEIPIAYAENVEVFIKKLERLVREKSTKGGVIKKR